MKDFASLSRGAAKEWLQDKASRHAAAFSYDTLFSVAPLLLIAVAMAGLVGLYLGCSAAGNPLRGN